MSQFLPLIKKGVKNMNINTDYTIIPPYAVMLLLACVSGLALQYALNIIRGADKTVSSFITILSPMLIFFFASLLTLASSGGTKRGLSSMGGLFGMYASVFILAAIKRDRHTTKITLENCTVVLPLIYSISKMGCCFAGCCHGIPYHGAFCVSYSGKVTESGCLFPVQFAEVFTFFIIFIIGMIMLRRNSKITTISILIASATAKGLLDFLRESHIGKIISLNQILCLIFIVAGIIYTVVTKRAGENKTVISSPAISKPF